MSYSNVAKADRDALFVLDLTKFAVNGGAHFGYQVGAITTLSGAVTSKNSGEIYNQPVLTVNGGTNAEQQVWLEGSSFYDMEIARPSVLSRFLMGKSVTATGLLLIGDTDNVLLVNSYQLSGNY
jgi:hypothetical protein